MRPIPNNAWDAPNPDIITWSKCVKGFDSSGQCKYDNKLCKNAWCDANNVVHDGKYTPIGKEVIGSWSPDLSVKERNSRHTQSWNNQFGFPYEIGLFWNLTVGGVNQRAIGCPGLDEPFGTITEPNWPYRNLNSQIFGSPAMDCPVNNYIGKDEDRPLHEIVDELASDNEIFAEKFLEGWQMMTSNGYDTDELKNGPDNGWIGYLSLIEQEEDIEDFETYIALNAPVKFTDPMVSIAKVVISYQCTFWG